MDFLLKFWPEICMLKYQDHVLDYQSKFTQWGNPLERQTENDCLIILKKFIMLVLEENAIPAQSPTLVGLAVSLLERIMMLENPY